MGMITNDWMAAIKPEFSKQYYKELYAFVKEEYSTHVVYPPSEEIFNAYKPQFEAKGWDVIYIKQENSGQAAALSNGLKVFSGEYLMWPDSDDILYPEHISKKVALMEQNPEAGMGFFCLDQINEEEPDVIVKKIKRQLDGDNDPLMDDLLLKISFFQHAF